MILYWITTQDGYENWFIVAKSKKSAEQFHEKEDGYLPGSAKAEFICKIDLKIQDKDNEFTESVFWPSHKLLKSIGAKFITQSNPRIVNISGKVYVEGKSLEHTAIDLASNKAGVYLLQVQKTQNYKIGITTNIKKRIKTFETGNPFNLKFLFFVETKHYKGLERHLHEVFKANRARGEWFKFNPAQLKKLEATLKFICLSSSEFKFGNAKDILRQGRIL